MQIPCAERLCTLCKLLDRLAPERPCSEIASPTATEHACERHCYRAWLSSDQDDVCSALSRDLVLSTCRFAVKMHMQTVPIWLRLSHCKHVPKQRLCLRGSYLLLIHQTTLTFNVFLLVLFPRHGVAAEGFLFPKLRLQRR